MTEWIVILSGVNNPAPDVILSETKDLFFVFFSKDRILRRKHHSSG